MTRRRQLLRVSPAVALICAALFALAGCGQASQAPQPTADDPAPASGPETTPGGGVSGSTGSSDLDPSLAQWPAVGCDSRSVVSVDYGRMPHGFATPQEAVQGSPALGLPDGVLTMAPDTGKGPAQVWIVDPETQEIQAQVSVFRGPDGWFVDGVMTCS